MAFAVLLAVIAGFIASQAVIVVWLMAGAALAVASVIAVEWLFRHSIDHRPDDHVPGGFESF